ncbi:hypothetical protein C1X59_05885 [Pseudomonas sp. FW215-R2]|uniref:hypothetical protein n=1 Tax=unclassified Pseudomonas TaxID=196821 RepID=UPI000C884687|nr:MULTISPECIES: hypothetical protein [unclassified Pseudomonas]PMX03149.1 hypothetical protein C1X59_05885 [Pseudomonas sp. FW215-R2]PMX11885.1 hypothetical protein C1X60_04775 [Pseudomonas sp. FW215-L1]PMX25555.1 hypothetical protein C1X57_03515 [Pseudomonas sp. FW215-E1]PNA32557.1 hypothetical protein C1X58_02995 [Pseudomonas sp. FW215-R4]
MEQAIEAFLDAFPTIRCRPTALGVVSLAGRFPFSAKSEEYPHLTDEYRIRIDITEPLDRGLPLIYETAGRIPQLAEYHVNPGGSLCLGSLLRVRLALGAELTLCRFVEKCLVPFLYTQSLREKGIASFPFGELAHGSPGLIDDYLQIFGVSDRNILRALMELMSFDRGTADEHPCPCGCGRKFADCQLYTHAHKAVGTLTAFDLRCAYEEIW